MTAPGAARNLGGSWRVRRRIVCLTLAFCAAVVGYSVSVGGDSRVLETAVLGAFALSGAVIGSYVFGAVWEDNTVARLSMKDQQHGE